MESILYSSDDESALIVVKTQWDTNNSDSDAEDNINSTNWKLTTASIANQTLQR